MSNAEQDLEKAAAGLRKYVSARRRNLAIGAALVLFLAGCLAFLWRQYDIIEARASLDAVRQQVPDEHLAIAIWKSHVLAVLLAKLNWTIMFVAIMSGVVIGGAIVNFLDRRNDLLLSLWDRIAALEEQVKREGKS